MDKKTKFLAVQEIARRNVISATKDRLLELSFNIAKIQMDLQKLMEQRDEDQKYLIDLYERGPEAMKE